MKHFIHCKLYTDTNGFNSVVVITLASHARGPGFDPQRNHIYAFTPINKRDMVEQRYDNDCRTGKMNAVRRFALSTLDAYLSSKWVQANIICSI